MGFLKSLKNRLIDFFIRWSSGPLGKVVYFFIRQIGIYTLAILIFLLFYDAEEHKLNLINLVLTIKLMSFVSIIWVNGEYALAPVSKGDRLVKWGNSGIIIYIVVVLTPLVFVKMGIFAIAEYDEEGILAFCKKNSYWLTSSSIFAYMLLDVWITFFKKATSEEKAKARKYFIFADIVTVFPFTLITFGIYFLAQQDVVTKSDLELFLNGSLVITILSYTLATKAVHVYN